ncbi:MAG: type 1 glutamine amidotransferase [Deltaproteobacteria bacterium]|nr:type 1 glutamine amidotransferase [Deltaproteobacteria bacterium]
MNELRGKKFALLVENLYDEHEFWYPRHRLKEAGAAVVVAGTEAGKEYHGKVGMLATADAAFSDLKAEDFDGVIIPGGFAPDYMRRSDAAKAFVKAMNDRGKLVAFICHAGWLPISAGIVKGRKATSVGAIKDDMVNAGAEWHDAPVVVDKNMITSRRPDDLPEFMKAVIAFFGS